MNEKRYVQYKNDPNGTKWEVYDVKPTWYVVLIDGIYCSLPACDYILCAPPERWTDITEHCEATYKTLTGPSAVWNVSLKMPNKNENYTFRLRKVQVQGWTFIVEKRED